MTKKRRQWLLAFFIGAFILRFGLLGHKSLWLDEAFSVNLASRSQDEILDGQYDTRHPPLYYYGLHYWLKGFGRSEKAVRLPSALVSMFSLIIIYRLGQRLFDDDVALVATGLLAFSSLDIWYAQEARMYAFITFVGLSSALGLVLSGWFGIIVTSIALLFGLYLDYTMIPLWTGISAIWLVYWWQQPRRKTNQLFVWFIPSMVAWWGFQLEAAHFKTTLNGLSTAYIFNRIQAIMGIATVSARQYILLMGIIGSGLVIAASLFSHWMKKQTVRQIMIPIVLIGYAVATFVLVIPRFYTVKRILVTGWPFVILLVAWSIVRIERGRELMWRSLLLLSLLSSLAILAVPKDNWQDVLMYLDQKSAPEDVVWIDPRWNSLVYDYYTPQKLARYDTVNKLEEVADKNVWLIAERFLGQPTPSSDSELWLDKNMQLVEVVPFYRLELRHYHPYLQ